MPVAFLTADGSGWRATASTVWTSGCASQHALPARATLVQPGRFTGDVRRSASQECACQPLNNCRSTPEGKCREAVLARQAGPCAPGPAGSDKCGPGRRKPYESGSI